MRCHEIMKEDVQFVVETQTAEAAAKRMRDHNIGFLPVCSAEGRVLGTITDRDITVRVTAESRAAELCPLSDIMSRDVVACRPTDDIRLAEDLMAKFQKSRILLTDYEGKLKGVISLSDIVQHERSDRASAMLRSIATREAHA